MTLKSAIGLDERLATVPHTTHEDNNDSGMLACIGPSDGDELALRAARLARQLGITWHAVYVETPKLQRLPAAQRERILNVLKIARDLGAVTAILSGSDVAAEIAAYAHSRGLERLAIGASRRRSLWPLSFADKVRKCAGDLDIIALARPRPPLPLLNTATSEEEPAQASFAWPLPRIKRYLGAAAASLATAFAALPLLHFLDLANIVMLFLLTVVLVAVRLGRGAAIVATLVGIAAFDFFFVVPRFSFSVANLQYLATFAVMLTVGLIIAHLTAGLRYQARVASQREARARALYEFSRELSGALRTDDIFRITRAFIQRTFSATASLLLPDQNGRLQPLSATMQTGGDSPRLTVLDTGMAQWTFENATPCGIGTRILPGSGYLFLPLVAPMRTRGVLVIQPQTRRRLLIPEQRQHLETFATLAAIALERMHYVEVAHNALVHVESEKLRNSLLSTLSHDLRTPLTALVGLSESLATSSPALTTAQQELAQGLRDVALRMSTLVTNLLEMARIQSGAIKLNLQWQPIDEVTGSALRACTFQLKDHKIHTELPHDLPLVRFDAVLIERVLCNLLENAAKYTPSGTLIHIRAYVEDGHLHVAVEDEGPGLPAGREIELFEKFVRGLRESSTSGVGLGLAICRAIVEVHGGTIQSARSQFGGAALRFTLPLGTPPEMPDLAEPDLHASTHD